MARENVFSAGCVAVGLALLAWQGLGDFAYNDYDVEASASVHYLVTGHLLAFLRTAPAYGGSFLLRAPFALLPRLWGGGELAVYRMLAWPCLAGLGAFLVWLAARMRSQGSGRLARVTALGGLLAGPATLYILTVGHPEEILAGVALICAVLSARGGRWVWAAAFLGVAVATKSWALVGVAPVLVALPARRWSALALAGGIALIVLAPFELAQHLAARHAGLGVAIAGTGHIFNPWQAWWFFGDPHTIVRTVTGHVMAGYRAVPAWTANLTHPLIVLVPIPLSLLWLRTRDRSRPYEPLALLALVLLLRCVLDPWNNLYYQVPFLLAFTTWDALRGRGVPVLSLSAVVATSLVFQRLSSHLSPDGQAASYLVWAVLTGTVLSVWLYAPRSFEHLARAMSPKLQRTREHLDVGAIGQTLS